MLAKFADWMDERFSWRQVWAAPYTDPPGPRRWRALAAGSRRVERLPC